MTVTQVRDSNWRPGKWPAMLGGRKERGEKEKEGEREKEGRREERREGGRRAPVLAHPSQVVLL